MSEDEMSKDERGLGKTDCPRMNSPKDIMHEDE